MYQVEQTQPCAQAVALYYRQKQKKKKKMCEKSFKKEMHSWAFTYMVMPALIFNLIHKLFFVETSYMTL